MNDSYFDIRQLTEIEIEQFIEEGYVIARQVFPDTLVENFLSTLRAEIDLAIQNSPSKDPLFFVHKKVLYNETVSQIFTQRYNETLNELCGQGRWECDKGVGYWFVSYPDYSKSSWQPVQNSWHIDSNTENNVLTSKLGLLVFHLFTDIMPGGGGTAVRIGSHKYSARILEETEMEGLQHLDFSKRAVNATNHLPVIEITGKCGDVVFMHPLTVHARSVNISRQERIVGHKFIHLFEPMNFKRQNSLEYSPTEIAIIKSLRKNKI